MQSPRALGIFALAAVILAAISFAAVDISLSTADGDALPAVTITAAIIGTVALLASVLPAITWFVDAIHHARHDADIEPVALAVRQPALAKELGDDDL
jgi:fumarate reductase subunit D